MPTGPSECISRYSRDMSCAVGSTWCSGGRRRAQARPVGVLDTEGEVGAAAGDQGEGERRRQLGKLGGHPVGDLGLVMPSGTCDTRTTLIGAV